MDGEERSQAERYLALHLYHHEGLDPVVERFVHPLVASLATAGWIDGFFFVRYALGGPHVRLRLRLRETSEIAKAIVRVREAMERAAEHFLADLPSTRSLEEEAIRRTNETILAHDSSESDAAVYPDNSFRLVPFHPEVERYGGPERFLLSLDFFTLSSVSALEFLACRRLASGSEATRARLLGQALGRLLNQALAFAADEAELADLLRFGMDWWGEALPKVVEKGGRVAEARRDDFFHLFDRSLAEVVSVLSASPPSAGAAGLLVLGARRLSTAIGTADRAIRARIGASQLHLSANRLGLSNAEEVYLSRLLTETLSPMSAAGLAGFPWRGEERTGSEGLGDLLPAALQALAATPGAMPPA
ncbi:MAG TPA: lantibiotic dehydratase C-terminal domain-containing protein [Thermoanaerobaculia bacterium]|nr:lantibiotic dehydratase C-terminal domain-containing protein [Thermoanaerobaculia bacterium]